ncbi:MAG: hypothetical protein KAS72_06710 [Phycisphaerales bacterium]|nr:hypothetical protein [Phycisphaerales bacterium]
MKWFALRQPAFLVALLLLCAGAASLRTTVSVLEYHLKKLPVYAPDNRQLRSLPATAGDWSRAGKDDIFSAEMIDELGTRNYLNRMYVRRRPDAGPTDMGPEAYDTLQAHFAYYTGMIDAVPHVPERCFVGGGLHVSGGPWIEDLPIDSSRFLRNYYSDGYDLLRVPAEFRPDGRDTVRIPDGVESVKLRITRFEDPRQPGKPMFAGYLFLANGRFITHAEEVRAQAFNLKEDYAYYLKIQFTAPAGTYEEPEELATASADLLNELLPGLLLCIPDWVEVQRGTYPADNPRGKHAKDESEDT